MINGADLLSLLWLIIWLYLQDLMRSLKNSSHICLIEISQMLIRVHLRGEDRRIGTKHSPSYLGFGVSEEAPAGGGICLHRPWAWSSVQFVRGVAGGLRVDPRARVLRGSSVTTCTFREKKKLLWCFSGFWVDIVANLNLLLNGENIRIFYQKFSNIQK